MISNNWLLENLNAEIAKFDDSVYVSPKHQMKALELCRDLLSYDRNQVATLSKARLRAREHARTALIDTFLGVGPEAFILCSISTSISRLAKTSLPSLVPDLRKWWKAASHPQGLIVSAKDLCETYSIPALVAGNKNRHPEIFESTRKLVSSSERFSLVRLN